MKEGSITQDVVYSIRDVEIPKAVAGQLVIKVKSVGANPKDYKTSLYPPRTTWPLNNGDDITGIVHEVGEGVVGFKPGDRVLAFHEFLKPHGGWAEYAMAPAFMTAHLPGNISFAAGTTLPLAYMTGVNALYSRLSLPHPFTPVRDRAVPLFVYGASTAIGAFTIKLARLSNLHPIIAVAGAGSPYVRTLLDPARGDVVLDYRQGFDHVRDGVRKALEAIGNPDVKLRHAFDGVSHQETLQLCADVLADDGESTIAMAIPPAEPLRLKAGTTISHVWAGDPFGPLMSDTDPPVPGAADLGFVYMQALSRWLATGEITPHPVEVVPGGLDGIPEVLERLKQGKASALKYAVEL